MLLYNVLHLFSRKSKLNLDRATQLVQRDHFSPPIVADFCAHKISFCVAVGTFAAYPFVSLRNCKF